MNPKTSTLVALCLAGIAGVIVFFNLKKNDAPLSNVPENTNDTRASDRQDVSPPTGETGGIERPESPEELAANSELARIERAKLTSMWTNNASSAFDKTSQYLVTDLNLSAIQADALQKVFARRKNELASLLESMTSGVARDDKEDFREICALIRNQGLRDDLAGILSQEQLQVFDAKEEKREREMVEARAYRDMAQINAVLGLADSQKKEVLGVLMNRAPEKVEQEADSRAFMTLTYGPLANVMESSGFRGLTNLVNEGLMGEGGAPNMDIYSQEYGIWAESQKTRRIENDLSALSEVLDESQLARYREFLEQEPAW